MTRERPIPYSDDMILDLDDFLPHDLDKPQPPTAEGTRTTPLPELLLCLAVSRLPADRLPERLRWLTELTYRIEEALLARGTPLRRALCCGAAALPFDKVTTPDALSPDAFAPLFHQAQPLFQSLAQACALAASFPSAQPTRLVLMTDLPPDGLPQAMLQRMLGQIGQHRPNLRAALVYCGQEQTVWTASLRHTHTLQPILPDDSEQMYAFLLEGGSR